MSDGDGQPSEPEATKAHPHKRRKRRTRLGKVRSALQGRSSTLLTVLIALVVCGSLLAVGTVHVVTLLFVAPLALVAGAFAIWVEDDPKHRFALPAVIATALAFYSLLQSVPLPLGWVRALSPVAAQTWTDALTLAQAPLTRWVSLSVDPGAARVEALKWLSYGALFVAAAKLARQRGSQRGLVTIVGTALLGGLLSVAHGLGGVEEWLFIYRPQFARPPWAVAPLLNPNNFAGYLNLALFAGMGLLFAGKPKVPRAASAAAIVLLAALVILTGSRGGVLALIVGFLVAGLTFRFQQSRSQYRQTQTLPAWLPLIGVGIAALALSVIGATDVVWEQLLDETTGKLRIIEYSQAIIRDHLWLGIGRGAFGTAFAAYRQDLGETIAQYAENFVVQWLVEWGIPVAVLGLVGLFWTMRPSKHGFGKNAQQTGALIAVGVLLLQNLVDLATEIPSVAIATFVLLGTVHGATVYLAEKRNKHPTDPVVVPRAARLSAIAAACLIPALALWALVAKTSLPEIIDERVQLSKEVSELVGKPKGHPAFERLRAHVTSAMLRYPADPYVPLLGALLTRESGKSPYTWLNQALRRDPLSAKPHLLLAETLAARGSLNQALLELKTTAKLSPALVGVVSDHVLRWAPTLDLMLRAIPEGTDGIGLLNNLAQRQSGSPEGVALHQQLLTLSLKRNEREPNTNAIVVSDLLSALETNREPCVGDGQRVCKERLRHHADIVLADRTQPQRSVMLHAQLLAHEKRYDEADRWLAERCSSLPDPVSCNSARVSYSQQLPELSRFEEAATAYSAAACSTPVSCASAFDWLGNIEAGHNRFLSALSRYERAAEELPTAEAWLKVAEFAARAGRYGRSETALMTARRLGGTPKTGDLEKRLLEIRRTRMLQELEKQ